MKKKSSKMKETFSSFSGFCGFLSLSLLISLSIREGREGGGVMSDDTQREEMCVKMGGLVWNQEQKGN